MIGMDRVTGLPISGVAHIHQSIGDILSTPLGSRRSRPEYGSGLRRFVDLPVNEGWKGAVQAEAARAIRLWEPRVDLEGVQVIAVVGGKITFRVRYRYLGESEIVELSA
ncbi:GPW/gp25 family protein [Pseudomonas viridiflava]|uniref:GPW/gp25 family protein n=1 Tax=Pseudomonas viridiflava TaxID=33069 RepID=UPI000F01B62E|nr:GPW/gp25 family protein [Pseudomonas viridiflava]